ncbi:uncharacterized protein LOC129741142 [Uranotaenia lowii]|uniref:uncharacterized protein LOC129741142 n=1 Tax=Uranotaenia lowii TaxID=190385 RepID=UPI002479B1EB|nr:uncharacterized protein LOC129741142 [Uranotaenia lowii]
MHANEYRAKMSAMVSDTTTYVPLTENPTDKTLSRINGMVKEWYTNKHIDKRTRDKILLFNCPPPRIYGLPKTHKGNRPLRPVVSTVGSAPYRLAQFLANILQKLVGKTEYHVRSSFDFAEEISKIQIPEGYVLFSLDVVSLYTNIPVQDTYELIKRKWGEISRHTNIPWLDFLRALQIVLDASFFQYNGKMYKQIFGVGMGSPLSGVVANILLEHLEEVVITELKTKGINLIIYKRYVDDCLLIAEENRIDEIQNEFNKPFESIKFTVEKETNCSIRFLDMTLTRKNNKINKHWFTKQTNGRYLDFSSASPHAHKMNTAIALIDRALKLTDVEERNTLDIEENSTTRDGTLTRTPNKPKTQPTTNQSGTHSMTSSLDDG